MNPIFLILLGIMSFSSFSNANSQVDEPVLVPVNMDDYDYYAVLRTYTEDGNVALFKPCDHLVTKNTLDCSSSESYRYRVNPNSGYTPLSWSFFNSTLSTMLATGVGLAFVSTPPGATMGITAMLVVSVSSLTGIGTAIASASTINEDLIREYKNIKKEVRKKSLNPKPVLILFETEEERSDFLNDILRFQDGAYQSISPYSP